MRKCAFFLLGEDNKVSKDRHLPPRMHRSYLLSGGEPPDFFKGESMETNSTPQNSWSHNSPLESENSKVLFAKSSTGMMRFCLRLIICYNRAEKSFGEGYFFFYCRDTGGEVYQTADLCRLGIFNVKSVQLIFINYAGLIFYQ